MIKVTNKIRAYCAQFLAAPEKNQGHCHFFPIEPQFGLPLTFDLANFPIVRRRVDKCSNILRVRRLTQSSVQMELVVAASAAVPFSATM
jgi:hypothetical protein